MKRILSNDDSNNEEEPIETKKRVKTSKSLVAVLGLCIASAKALIPTNKSTPWSRAIHIPKSPIADPSLLVQLHAVLVYRNDFAEQRKRQPILRNLAKEFPLTRCRRVLAAIHCQWTLRHHFPAYQLEMNARPSYFLCTELRKWVSPREFDYLLIHASITNLFGMDTQELLLQTPSIFARHLETTQRPFPLAFEVNMLLANAHQFSAEYPDMAVSVVYPNIQNLFCKLATRTSERLRFDFTWIFNTVTSLPLIQAVWPLINLCECPTPMPISSLKQAPLETLNWVIEHMPRAAKQQFLAQQRAQMWIDPALRNALGIDSDSHDEW